MPRTLLYHTAEEKRAANRAKSLKSYHKCVYYVFWVLSDLKLAASLILGIRHPSATVDGVCGAQLSQYRIHTLQKGRASVTSEHYFYITTSHRGQMELRTMGHDSEHVQLIMKRLKHHANRFSNLCKPSPTIFLDELTLKVIMALRKGSPEDAAASVEQQISLFQDLQQEVASSEDDILTLVGFGQETEALKQTMHQINLTVRCLEDLYCACYDGYDALRQAHMNAELLYQKVY